MSQRQFVPVVFEMGVDEAYPLEINFAGWPHTTPLSTPTTTLKNAAGQDVTATYATGAAAISGEIVTTKRLAITAPGTYRLEVGYTDANGNVFEGFGTILVDE